MELAFSNHFPFVILSFHFSLETENAKAPGTAKYALKNKAIFKLGSLNFEPKIQS